VPIQDYDVRGLREQIAITLQDAHVVPGTVADNLRYGNPGATAEEIEEAARAANAHHFIEDLPAGYETKLGEDGTHLSGGQRQSLSIARAFLKDAPILLLDEATSALDSESEEAIREALGRLMRGRTVIAIAHRLSTLRNFDRVIVLKNGKIIEDGQPACLMRKDGHYGNLVAKEMSRLSVHAA
jgi:ATP-binding cassette, subfamily B, bacterial